MDDLYSKTQIIQKYDESSKTYVNHRSEINYMAKLMELGMGIPSKLFIPYTTFLISSVKIPCYNELDVEYDTPYGEGYTEKKSKTEIPFRKDIFGKGFIIPVHNDKLRGKAYNPYVEHFKSIAKIAENSELDVIMDLIQPPIITDVINCTQDAYTRQSRPTTNYGGQQTLVIGKGTDGDYITYIDLDLSGLSVTAMNFISINLSFNKLESTNGTMLFYENSTTWFESYIIWLNKMTLSSTPLFSKSVTGTTCEINIKSLVIEKLKQGQTKLSLAIKSTDYLILNSRESGSPIKLIIQYSDPNWIGFVSKIDKFFRATIRQVYKKDFYSAYKLAEHAFSFGKAYFKDPTINYSKAEINKPYIFGNSEVILSNYKNAKANIIAQSYNDIDSKYDQKTSNYNGNVKIPFRNDKFGKVIIPPESESSDGVFKTDLIRTFVLCLTDIFYSSNKVSNAIIKVNENSDLISRLEALNNVISSKAKLVLHKDLYSKASIIRNNEKQDIINKMDIEAPWVYSNYRIVKSKDIFSKVKVKTSIGNDTNSKSDFVKPIIPSKYALVKNHNVISKYTLTLRYDLLNGKANITQYFNVPLYSKAIIRRNDNSDTESCSSIPFYNSSFGKVIIRRSDIHTFINKVKIRRYDNWDLKSSSDIARIKDTFSKMLIWQNKILLNKAVLRQSDLNEWNFKAFVKDGFYHENLMSKITIRKTINEILGSADIKTQARQWEPNHEGELDYEDKRLPREWNWRDFILGLNQSISYFYALENEDGYINPKSINTDYWETANHWGIVLSSKFWDGRNDALSKFGAYGIPRMIDKITNYHFYLFKLFMDTRKGFTNDNLNGTWESFRLYCRNDSNFDLITDIQLADIWMTYHLKVICKFFNNSISLFETPAMNMLRQYIDPNILMLSCDFMDFSNSSDYGGYFYDILGTNNKGCINVEPDNNFSYAGYIAAPNEYYFPNGSTNYTHAHYHWMDGEEDTIYNDYNLSFLSGYINLVYVVIHEIAHGLDNFRKKKTGISFSESYEWKNIGGWISTNLFSKVKTYSRTEWSNITEPPPTAYGCTSAGEDFADSYASYMINPKLMIEQYPQRYEFFEKFVKSWRG